MIWEVKNRSNANRVYTNSGDGGGGDASGFVQAINKKGLCGANDWRLPTVTELQSIVYYGSEGAWPAILWEWFPLGRFYESWTSERFAYDLTYGWTVDFYKGHVRARDRGEIAAVRLVRIDAK